MDDRMDGKVVGLVGGYTGSVDTADIYSTNYC
jgi:hypothetical protein